MSCRQEERKNEGLGHPPLGRFSSPDPLAGSIADPQSLNRYAYVLNDPVGLVDPLGLCIGLLNDNGDTVSCVDSLGCTIDGAIASCRMAGNLLRSGAGVVCPFASCSGLWVGADDRWYRQVEVSFSFTSTSLNCEPSTYIGGGLNGEPGGWQAGGCTSGILQISWHTWVLAAAGGNSSHDGAWLDSFLYGLSDFSAGAADCLTGRCFFLGTSLTEWIRRQNGADSVVNKNSGAYLGGEITGVVVLTALTASGGATGAALANGKNGALFGRGGALLNRSSVRFGWSWDGPAIGGRDVIRLGLGAARGTKWWSHIPFHYP